MPIKKREGTIKKIFAIRRIKGIQKDINNAKTGDK